MSELGPDSEFSASTGDPTLLSVAAYSAIANDYERDHAARRAEGAARFAASLPSPSLILDAGCGPGRDLARFVADGHVVRGVDLNREFVTRARRHALVLQMDLRDLGRSFPSGFFDGIWAEASLVHLPLTEAELVLRDFASLLRHSGKLLVSVRSEGTSGWQSEPGGRRWYSVWEPDDLERAATEAGFNVDDVVRGPYTQLWATRSCPESAR